MSKTQSYCGHCRIKTDDKSPRIEGLFRKSLCAKCGHKKSTVAKGGRIPKKNPKPYGGRLAYPGEYFPPVKIDEDYPHKKRRMRPSEYVYQAGMAQQEMGGALITSLPADFNPLHPVIPRNVDVDFEQGIYSGHALPTGEAGGSGIKTHKPLGSGCEDGILATMMPLENQGKLKKRLGPIDGHASERSRGPQPVIQAGCMGDKCCGTCEYSGKGTNPLTPSGLSPHHEAEFHARQGQAGEGQKLNIKLHKGDLTKHGYKVNESDMRRHMALDKAVHEFGPLQVFHKVNILYVYTKKGKPDHAQRFHADARYVADKYLGKKKGGALLDEAMHAFGDQGDEPIGQTVLNIGNTPCVNKAGRGLKYL